MINIDALKLKEIKDSIKLIDVRTQGEVSTGMIEGAEHVPMHVIPLSINKICTEKPIVVYCRSGARSMQVVSFLRQNGCTDVYNLSGGIDDWVRSGNKLS